MATFRPAIASAAARLTQIALLPTPPLALATATTARTSASFRMAAAPLSAWTPAGVLSDSGSQKILVANDTFQVDTGRASPRFTSAYKYPRGTT